ncbi:MAG: nickel pincer cofactor biosynthesis protein LarC [Anaerolineae bacterium]|nr:nickel pincer cofactor biosynthesis protein LarC [Anaerolineae bacterium]
MSILYCDCFSGISGDMFLAALMDAGMPVEHLDAQFHVLHLVEYRGVQVEPVMRGALRASLLRLDIAPADDHHHHHHRHLGDIRRIVEESGLAPEVKATTMQVFEALARAEAAVHGATIEDVHFHEVGAVDSILDIVGAAVGLAWFDVQAVYASALPLGGGRVETQHGVLPLPAPATLELLRSAGAPLVPSTAEVELVTPTGAAILASLARFEQPAMRLQHTGTGAGGRDLPWANVLRLLIGEATDDAGMHVEIETNIDDMNPQLLGDVMGRLLQAGALDVYFTPIYMKKNRPATKLSIVARSEDEAALSDLVLRHTTTLGVRARTLRRYEAAREVRRVQTSYGEVGVKVKIMDGEVLQAQPEFDDCARLAAAADVPLAAVMQAALLASQVD